MKGEPFPAPPWALPLALSHSLEQPMRWTRIFYWRAGAGVAYNREYALGFLMAISDTYLVQWLLQETKSPQGGLSWREKDNDGHLTTSNGVQIELDHVMSRSGTRRQLTLTYDSERIRILEPTNTGILTEQYATEDEWQLVQLLRELNQAVHRQCAARRNRGDDARRRVRDAIFRRVIGAEDNGTDPAASQ